MEPSISSAAITTSLCHTQVIFVFVQSADTRKLPKRPLNPLVSMDCQRWPRVRQSKLCS